MPALRLSGRATRALARVFMFVAALAVVEQGIATPRKAREMPLPAAALDDRPRFFTIKDVLARHDSFEAWNLRLVSLGTDRPLGELRKGAEPFGFETFRAPEGVLWIKWRGLQAELKSEAEALERCRSAGDMCSPAARQFLALVDAARVEDMRLETVNRMVNGAIRYTSDMAQHGVADRWTAPLATLAAGAGDCEDYAIMKYAVLRAAGLAAEDMRVLLVRDLQSRQDHAVLAVRQQTRWLILDNRWAEPADAAELRRFVPSFSIDERGVNLLAAPYAGRSGA